LCALYKSTFDLLAYCVADPVDYPQWEVSRQKRVVPSDYVPPTAPFEGNSRYKSDFPLHGRTPRESFKPVENTIRSDRASYELQHFRRIQRSVNTTICNAFQCVRLGVEYPKLMAT